MTSEKPLGLVISRDASLLLSRELIVERAGARPLAATNVSEAESILTTCHPCVVVICHTIGAEDRHKIESLVSALTPETVVLEIERGQTSPGDVFAFTQGAVQHLGAS